MITMTTRKRNDDVTGPWGISVRTPTKQIMKVIPREDPEETLKEVLDRAKVIAKAIRDKYNHRDDVVVEIISRSKAFPKPDTAQLRRGELWCPYCAKVRRFKKNIIIEIDGVSYPSDISRCIVCHMSETDYYVMDYNHLWPRDLYSRIKTKKG